MQGEIDRDNAADRVTTTLCIFFDADLAAALSIRRKPRQPQSSRRSA